MNNKRSQGIVANSNTTQKWILNALNMILDLALALKGKKKEEEVEEGKKLYG